MTMNDGRRHVAQVDFPKGSVEVPMSDAEIEEKFRGLATDIVGKQNADAIVQKVHGVEACRDIRELMALTRARD